MAIQTSPRNVMGLTLEHITLSLGAVELVPPIDVAIASGERVTVMGPSGSGKSTLLAYIAGTIDTAFTASGRVTIDGRDITELAPERRGVGILFQDDLLFPHLSVGDNLGFALRPSMHSREERRKTIANALAEADLAGFDDRDPATLSGGQRARVALMRTLVASPRALLLDEPFNKLDARLRADFRRFVFEHAQRRGLPTLLVTHDVADADAAGGRIITLGA